VLADAVTLLAAAALLGWAGWRLLGRPRRRPVRPMDTAALLRDASLPPVTELAAGSSPAIRAAPGGIPAVVVDGEAFVFQDFAEMARAMALLAAVMRAMRRQVEEMAAGKLP